MLRILMFLALVALVACAPVSTPIALPDTLPASTARFAAAGPERTLVALGSFRAGGACTLEYEVWSPAAGGSLGVVVLAHGFLRDLRSMRGWAQHFASYGYRAVAVSLCQSTPFAGRHSANAEDLLALATALTPDAQGPRVYAGFSAGALVALLAAHADPRATGVLALDPVDSGDLLAALPPSTLPALVLLAEPSSCNADANAEALLRRWPNAQVLRVTNATHCHFENPYARACEWVCGRVTPAFASAAIMEQIRALSSAWLLAFTDSVAVD